ncbi:IS701 family transposase [Streptomyces lanatus]|uniref:Transposase n=1 Tax=Streptomyces lanatus TaxID=66900 RepID=A0ABV1XJH2_9ACTN|nr:transposase [Streptomyces lanatus]GHG91386.1 putative ISXo8 transposase [Streptomyces lanatus]
MRDGLDDGAAAGEGPIPDVLDAELCRRLFGSLHRSGQRVKAEQYVRGLLSVRGRKTLRSIAAQFDGASAQQNVHHFIASSPWEWVPVRHALARQAQRALAPQAWVIDSLLIPKAGPHSVGADPQPTPLGTVNGQQAVGTWLTSERAAVPVDWQLRLSARWTVEPLRHRASVPPDAVPGTVEECVRQAVVGLMGVGEMPRLPVVVDVAEADGISIARFLASTGLPFAVRVDAAAPVRIDRSLLPKYGDLLHTAGELSESLPHLRQQVNPGDGRTTAAAIPVSASPSGREAMTLLGECPPGRPAEPRLWLTNFTADRLAPALRLTRLPGVVERDCAEISDGVGLRDFAGRSFPGWHRHITLACVAHLVSAAARRGDVTHINRTTVR